MSKKKENINNYNQEKHHEMARKIAEDSIVLLKNDKNILPINKQKIAVIGDMAKNPRYQGAGSSTINPYKIENIYDCLKEKNIKFDYAKGYNRVEQSYEEEADLQKEAIELAKKNDIVLICVGLTENYESEGMDRTILDISKNQNELINKICEVNENVVIVLSNGSPICMPWINKVKGIITGYLGGEAGASAMVNCLFGDINPSGKLSETYPLKLEDTPCFKNFPGSELSVEYKESIYVGYRYYDKVNKKVLFPFGYGMSYTQFKYRNLNIKDEKDRIEIEFYLKNIGNKKGKEIAQIYVGKKEPKIFRPIKELKDFVKIELAVGEERKVNLSLNKEDLSYFNPETRKWSIEQGIYNIFIGSSSENIELQKEIYILSEDKNINKEYPQVYYKGDIQNVNDKDFECILNSKIPDRVLNIKDVTQENTLEQIKNTKIGAYIYSKEMEKMQKLLKEQNVNKATKVMMDLQKPLKKFYEKKSSGYTKEMVEELLNKAKTNSEDFKCEFVKKYTDE